MIRSLASRQLPGEGLADALTGADVVVDVCNSPSFDDGPVGSHTLTAAEPPPADLAEVFAKIDALRAH
jgi:hypothetical protein